MPVFGNSVHAGADDFPLSNDRALIDQFTISEDGDLSALFAYISDVGVGEGLKGFIFSDSSGSIGTLLGVTSAVTLNSGHANTFVELPITITLPAGTYWLGVVNNGSATRVGIDPGEGSVDMCMANGTFSYASPPSSWPGTDGTYGVDLSIYGEYEPAGGGEEPVEGTTSLTTAASAALLGAAELAGTSALSLAPAAAVGGAASLAGTSSLALSPAAALAGTAALVGTSSLSFTAAASSGSEVGLEGTAALSLATQAVLDTQVQIVATTLLSTAAVAALLLRAQFLAGLQGPTFDADAVVAAVASIAGASSLTFYVAQRSVAPVGSITAQRPDSWGDGTVVRAGGGTTTAERLNGGPGTAYR